MRAVFMGTPEFAVPSLNRLITGGYDVVTVYTQPDRRAGRGLAPLSPPVKAAAQRLGISRSTLYEKLKRHQITHPTTH